jgi:hypothetical protein
MDCPAEILSGFKEKWPQTGKRISWDGFAWSGNDHEQLILIEAKGEPAGILLATFGRQSKESDQDPVRAGVRAIGLRRSRWILVDSEPLIRRNLLC